MKEVTFKETEHGFYDYDEDEECFYEMEILTQIEFDENIMEIVETEESDYQECSKLMHSESNTTEASYEIEDLKDGEKLKVTMFKIGMPNGDILSIPVLKDERAEFISSSYNGYDYEIYEEDGKREATDEEIDMIE